MAQQANPYVLVAGDGAGLNVYIVRSPANPWVLVAERYALPTRFEVHYDKPPRPKASLTFGLADSGELECETLTVERRPGEGPVKSSSIRGVYVDTIRREAYRYAAAELVQGHDGQWAVRHAGISGEVDPGDVLAAFARAGVEPRRSKRLSPEKLEEAARIYRAALREGRPPTKALTEAPLYLSRATAGRWVAEARERGLLGPAPARRRAGEITSKEGKRAAR